MPCEYQTDFFFHTYALSYRKTAISSWLDHLIKQCDTTDREHSRTRQLLRVCNLVLSSMKSWVAANGWQSEFATAYDVLLEKVIKAGLLLGRDDML